MDRQPRDIGNTRHRTKTKNKTKTKNTTQKPRDEQHGAREAKEVPNSYIRYPQCYLQPSPVEVFFPTKYVIQEYPGSNKC